MKNIPIYKELDLALTGKKDDNLEVEIFREFILQLPQIEALENSDEKKIIDNVQENGTYLLNDEELVILKKIVVRYEKECNVCNTEIPLNEVLYSGTYCSNHKYLKDE